MAHACVAMSTEGHKLPHANMATPQLWRNISAGLARGHATRRTRHGHGESPMRTRMTIGFLAGAFFGGGISFLSLGSPVNRIWLVGGIVDWLANCLALPGWIVIGIVPGLLPTKGLTDSILAWFVLSNALFYALAGVMLGWYLWRRRLSSRVDGPRCRNCDYSLIGNTSGICPECGCRISALGTDTEKAL